MCELDPTPFAEAPWTQGVPSPYYTESHRTWQKDCRKFIYENLGEHSLQYVKDGQVPMEVYHKFAEAGMLIPSLPAPLPIQRLKQLGIRELLGGLKLEDFDYFHFLIYIAEVRAKDRIVTRY